MKPDLIFLQEALAATAALQAADRLGVFERLSDGPVSAASLVRDCGIANRGAELLLAAMSGIGLLEKNGAGSYRKSVPDLGTLRLLAHHFDHLTEAIRDDQPVAAGDTPAGAESLYPQAVDHLASLFSEAAKRVADHLAKPGLQILEAGSGAAPWSLAIASRCPDCRVTAVDLPAVLPVTRRAVQAAGRQTQYRYIAGDFFQTELGSSAYDLAIAGGICHLFDEGANRILLARLFRTLRPGGRLAIIDALPNENLDGPRSVVLYALGLLLRSRRGRVYPFSAYAGWLRDTGFEAIDRSDIDLVPSVSLITARRPPHDKGG